MEEDFDIFVSYLCYNICNLQHWSFITAEIACIVRLLNFKEECITFYFILNLSKLHINLFMNDIFQFITPIRNIDLF